MSWRWIAPVLLTIAIVACRSKPSSAIDAPSATTTVSAPIASASAPVPSASIANPLQIAADHDASAATCVRYSYDRGMRDGRAAIVAKNYEDADRAFDEAVRARPYDARARAERAYARILDNTASIDELDLAAALTKDDALLAQIYFNEGLFYEKRQSAEPARFAFVLAERHGSKPAKNKLGNASRCTVTVKPGASGITLAKDWRGVLDAIGEGVMCADKPVVTSEDDARAYACGGCDGANEPWKRGKCDGAGPWSTSLGGMMCSLTSASIVELGPSQFAVESGVGLTQPEIDQDGTRIRRKFANHEWLAIDGFFSSENGSYRIAEGWTDANGALPEDESKRCLADEHTDVELEMRSGCNSTMGATKRDGSIWEYYDDKGKPLATMTLQEGDGKRVTIAFGAKELTIKGGGCDLKIGL